MGRSRERRCAPDATLSTCARETDTRRCRPSGHLLKQVAGEESSMTRPAAIDLRPEAAGRGCGARVGAMATRRRLVGDIWQTVQFFCVQPLTRLSSATERGYLAAAPAKLADKLCNTLRRWQSECHRKSKLEHSLRPARELVAPAAPRKELTRKHGRHVPRRFSQVQMWIDFLLAAKASAALHALAD